MTRRIRFAVVMTAALLALPGLATAQQLRIGVVNVARLITESPQAAAAMGALQEEFAPRQREIVAQQDGFKEKQAQVQRDLEVMGPEERRNAERDLLKEERDIKRNQEEFTEDFNLRRNEELGKLQRELQLAVQTFARDSGYDLVLSGEGVLFASQAVDITQQVLTGLQQRFQQPPTGN